MADDEFVCSENISRFADQLQDEHEPRKRAILNRLLIEEEDRYAALSSKHDFMMRKIVEVDQRIDKQQAMLRGLGERGADCTRAAAVLKNMLEIRNVCAKFCNQLLKAQLRAAP